MEEEFDGRGKNTVVPRNDGQSLKSDEPTIIFNCRDLASSLLVLSFSIVSLMPRLVFIVIMVFT